ncbi:hypothetical protein ACS0TY_033475 [Phlomoides rotata]
MGDSGDPDGEVLDLGLEAEQDRGNAAPICLVGRLCTGRSFNIYALIDVMLKAFRAQGKVTAREWGKKLLVFTFGVSSERDWVLRNQPWHFDGHLFAISPIDGDMQPSQVQVNKASFWARIYDLPLSLQRESTLLSTADRIGVIEAFDPPENNLGNYMRFKVEVDIQKPLCRGLRIRAGGGQMWIPWKFEFCAKYDKNDCLAPGDLDFGPDFKASTLRRARGQRADVKFYERSMAAPRQLDMTGFNRNQESTSLTQTDTAQLSAQVNPTRTLYNPTRNNTHTLYNPTRNNTRTLYNPTHCSALVTSTQRTTNDPNHPSSHTPDRVTTNGPDPSTQSSSPLKPTYKSPTLAELPAIQTSKPTTSLDDLSKSLELTTKVSEVPVTSSSHSSGQENTRRKTSWKREARERGAMQKLRDAHCDSGLSGKCRLEDFQDDMDVDSSEPVTKKCKGVVSMDSEAGILYDSTAVATQGRHCRDQ